MNNRGQTNLTGAIVSLAVAALITVIFIPIVQAEIDNANLTGATATIVGLVPLALGLVIMLAGFRLAGVL